MTVVKPPRRVMRAIRGLTRRANAGTVDAEFEEPMFDTLMRGSPHATIHAPTNTVPIFGPKMALKKRKFTGPGTGIVAIVCRCGAEAVVGGDVILADQVKQFRAMMRALYKHQGHGGFTVNIGVELPSGYDIRKQEGFEVILRKVESRLADDL